MASGSLGELGVGAYPLLYALVADEVGIPHAIDLQFQRSQNARCAPVKSLSDMLQVLRHVPFLPNEATAQQLGIQPTPAQPADLAQFLVVILDIIMQSPDGLGCAVDLMEPQSDPAMHTAYEPDGVISCYMRTVCVAFSSVNFEALNRLHLDLLQYAQLHLPHTSKLCTNRKQLPDLTRTRKLALDLGNGLPMESKRDFETVSNMYIAARDTVSATNVAIQSMSLNGQERGTDMSVPTVEYIVHLEAQRRRDFATAVDALHRYFDLSLAEIGRQSAAANSNRQGSDRTGREGAQTEAARSDIQGHQYAALSLGVLHAQFGNMKNASISLHDTIRAAQQCSDDACQARALSWIARTSPVTKRHQLLLHANDPLALAREELCTVFTPVSESVPESIHLDAFGVNGKRADGSSSDNVRADVAAARFSRIQSRIAFKNSQNRVDALLMSAAAWESHAASPTALTLARMALLVAERLHPGRISMVKAHALISVASLMAIEGEYEEAIRLLKESRTKYMPKLVESTEQSCTAPEDELVSRCETWIEFEHSLRKGETRKAGKLCETLTALAESNMNSTVIFSQEDLILDSLEAKCRWHLANQATTEAARVADMLCQRAAGFARPVRVIEGLRLRAEAHLMAGSSNTALPVVLASVSLSQGLGLETAHVKSVLTLTETMLHLDEGVVAVSGAHALQALLPVLGKALEGLGVHVRARAYRLHAECLLAVREGMPGDEIVRLLELSREAYECCEDAVGVRDVCYMAARVRHMRGEVAERNVVAGGFKKMVQLLSRRQSQLSY